MGVTVVPPRDEEEEDTVGVWRSNWDSVTAFLGCSTQAREVATFAGRIWQGLDYAGVDVFLRRSNARPSVFFDLQVMERTALETFAEVAP